VNARALGHQLHVVADGGELDREQEVRPRRDRIRGQGSSSVLAALKGRCLNAEPIEVAAVWGYGFDWCPLPALQSYGAYTSRLDRLDAARYADPENGPDGVIRADFAIDERLPAWESPAAMLALLCNFESAADGGGWSPCTGSHRTGLAAAVGHRPGPASHRRPRPIRSCRGEPASPPATPRRAAVRRSRKSARITPSGPFSGSAVAGASSRSRRLV